MKKTSPNSLTSANVFTFKRMPRGYWKNNGGAAACNAWWGYRKLVENTTGHEFEMIKTALRVGASIPSILHELNEYRILRETPHFKKISKQTFYFACQYMKANGELKDEHRGAGKHVMSRANMDRNINLLLN